jgi:uncharacterized protein YjbI with pentapeptide repeats
LQNANFSNANLEGANLEGANLQGANLQGANLLVADFSRTNLRNAKLPDYQKIYGGTSPELDGAIMPDGTIYQKESTR